VALAIGPATGPYAHFGAGARWFTIGDAALLATARVEGGVVVGRALRLGGFGRFAIAREDDPLGAAHLQIFTFGPSASYVFMSSAAARVSAGPRVELGAAFARGEGQGGKSSTAFVAGASLELALELRAAPWLFPFVAVEAGSRLRGVDVRAEDRHVLDVEGAFVGASAGVLLGGSPSSSP
jgi:hypothetical protein